MGCCLLVLLAFIGPRFVLFMLWLFSSYLVRPYPVAIVPVLGFFFLPWTTLAYAWAVNSGYGLSGFGLVVIIIALVIDLSTWGGGGRHYRSRYS
jgi:hypothetical protein